MYQIPLRSFFGLGYWTQLAMIALPSPLPWMFDNSREFYTRFWQHWIFQRLKGLMKVRIEPVAQYFNITCPADDAIETKRRQNIKYATNATSASTPQGRARVACGERLPPVSYHYCGRSSENPSTILVDFTVDG